MEIACGTAAVFMLTDIVCHHIRIFFSCQSSTVFPSLQIFQCQLRTLRHIQTYHSHIQAAFKEDFCCQGIFGNIGFRIGAYITGNSQRTAHDHNFSHHFFDFRGLIQCRRQIRLRACCHNDQFFSVFFHRFNDKIHSIHLGSVFRSHRQFYLSHTIFPMDSGADFMTDKNILCQCFFPPQKNGNFRFAHHFQQIQHILYAYFCIHIAISTCYADQFQIRAAYGIGKRHSIIYTCIQI